MNCNYQINYHGKKKILCPSTGHEGIVLIQDKEGKDIITLFCSHHRRVVEAKQTGGEVNEHGQFIRPEAGTDDR